MLPHPKEILNSAEAGAANIMAKANRKIRIELTFMIEH